MSTVTKEASLPMLDVLLATGKAGDEKVMRSLGTELVEAALGDFRHLRKLDKQIGESRGENGPFNVELAAMLRVMYEECAQRGDQVLDRVRRLKKRGIKVGKKAEQLLDEVGRTQAMLSVSLEDMVSASKDKGTERTYSLEELRSELQHRLQERSQQRMAAVGNRSAGRSVG